MDKNIVNDPSCFIGLPHMRGKLFSNFGYLNMYGELKKYKERLKPPVLSVDGNTLTITNPNGSGYPIKSVEIYIDDKLSYTLDGDVREWEIPYIENHDTGIIGFVGFTREDGELTYTDDISPSEFLISARYISGTDAVKDSAVGEPVVRQQDIKYSVSIVEDNANGNYNVWNKVSCDIEKFFPYNELEEFTDSYGNVFVKFPKMYIEWVDDENNHIDGIRVSKNKFSENSFIPDCFIDPSNPNRYLPYFAISKYRGDRESVDGVDRIVSKSGMQESSLYASQWVSSSQAYGNPENVYNGYQIYDGSMWTLYNFLCSMYYKTSNIQGVWRGCVGRSSSALLDTGICDGLGSSNGWLQSYTNQSHTTLSLTSHHVKMLGIEDPYGSSICLVDGVSYTRSSGIITYRRYVDSVPLEYGIISQPEDGQCIKYLSHGTTKETMSFAFVSETVRNSTGSLTGFYVNDAIGYADESITSLWTSGPRNTSSYYRYIAGLWYTGMYTSSIAGTKNARLAYRPINT